jgi:hypothetical protein
MQLFSFSKYTFFSIALGGALALAGCTKPTSVGSDVIPASDYINGTLVVSDANTADTATFRMNTSTIADTVVTYRVENPQVNLSRFPFGAANDPVFGKSWAGIYLQPAILSDIPPPAGLQSDSTVLVLQYDVPQGNNTFSKDATTLQKFKAAYITGDTTQTQSLNVYRVTDDMSSSLSTVYTANKTFAQETNVLGSLNNYIAKPTSIVRRNKIVKDWKNKDSINIAGFTMPCLRIPLAKALGDEMLSRTNDLKNNIGLRSFFKGIYIEPNANNTFLHRFNLLSSKVVNDSIKQSGSTTVSIPSSASQIIVYYHNSAGVKQSYSIIFSVDRSTTTGRFQHNITSTPVATALNPTSSKRVGDSVMYVQAMNGTVGKINFPNLAKLKGKVIINKAEIVFKAISDVSSVPKPDYLALLNRPDRGNKSIFVDIRDLLVGPLSLYYAFDPVVETRYGGALNGSIYTVNVTRQMQEMIGGQVSKNLQENNTLYIAPLGKAHNLQRVILGGARNRTYAPVLKVYMSYL